MADGFVVVQPDSTGKKIDSSEITVGANLVERQRIVLADNTTPAAVCSVANVNPAGSEYGIITRNIPSGTQPVSVGTAPQNNVHNNTTVTTSGASIYTGLGGQGYSLTVNIKNAPTGTAPSAQYSIQEVDDGDNLTPVGPTITGATIIAAGTQQLTFNNLLTGSVKISWTITGTTPSFTGVYASLKALTVVNPNLAPKTVTIAYTGGGDINTVVTVVGSQTRTDTFGYASGNLSSITTVIS